MIPSTPRSKLILPPSHLISDLKFEPCDPEHLADDEVEVEVRAYGLNFLDMLMVTKPDPVFEKFNHFGMDIAGIITNVGAKCNHKVGDRVITLRKSGVALPTHVVSKEVLTIPIPVDMNFADAATYTVAFFTVETCLNELAKITRDDVVHTASGGVGLCAIQSAQQIGCTIVVTAGNERKRNYLRSLGLEHVYNSRNTNYGREIRAALDGKGVTVVLNSLTGEGFKETTLELCDQGARFIEMSKMNVWSESDVGKIRPDVFYRIVDILAQPLANWALLGKKLKANLFKEANFAIKPLPYTTFNATEIREAIEHMRETKHIGKIVVAMPEIQKGSAPLQKFSFPLFNNKSTYVISGGLGGIGLEVAKWMVTSGARYFVLLGRNQPKKAAQDKIERICKQENDVRILVEKCDVGNFADVVRVFDECAEKMPPIRGIMHAAAVLDDSTYDNQTWTKYKNVFKNHWSLEFA